MFSKLRLEELYLKTVKKIRIESSDNKEFVHDLKASFGIDSGPLLPNCRLLEFNTIGVPETIKIDFWQTENVSFYMSIVEKNMALAKRRQKPFAYNGPLIGQDSLHETKHVGIGLRVKQSHFSDQDEEANCVNYPTEIYKSFRDCDEDFIAMEMQKIGVRAFWATKGDNN